MHANNALVLKGWLSTLNRLGSKRILSVIANDIGRLMKWLMVCWWTYHGCHRCWNIERSLVMHLWRVVVHSQPQANMMSIVVCLWRYVIMTTVWICVVCIWLLSLRVFFVLHATILEPENEQMSYRCNLVVNRDAPYHILTWRSVKFKFLASSQRFCFET